MLGLPVVRRSCVASSRLCVLLSSLVCFMGLSPLCVVGLFFRIGFLGLGFCVLVGSLSLVHSRIGVRIRRSGVGHMGLSFWVSPSGFVGLGCLSFQCFSSLLVIL